MLTEILPTGASVGCPCVSTDVNKVTGLRLRSRPEVKLKKAPASSYSIAILGLTLASQAVCVCVNKAASVGGVNDL